MIKEETINFKDCKLRIKIAASLTESVYEGAGIKVCIQTLITIQQLLLIQS